MKSKKPFDHLKKNKQAMRFALLVMLLLPLDLLAGPDDGSFISFNTLFESGPTNEKYNIVLMGDGFTEREQDLYNSKVVQLCSKLFDTHPFSSMKCAINFYRINIASVDSGVDKPGTCGDVDGTSENINRRTPLDASYCYDGERQRCIYGSEAMVRSYLDEYTPLVLGAENVVVYVLVNDTEHGGCALSGLTFGSIGNGFENTFIHELGHAMFDLADEYDYGNEGPYENEEPSRVNITIAQREIKWGDLILGGTGLPTSTCANDNPDGQGDDIVGIFEGANYHDCGIFRPQFTCKMKVNREPFCSVCRRRAIRVLKEYACTVTSFKFTNLLIRNDHDPWPKGDGEIYFHYTLSSPGIVITRRWPGSNGEWDFDGGQTRSLNSFFAGSLPSRGTPSISVQMRESDWGSDDVVRNDVTLNLSSIGNFEIDESEWKLNGQTVSANYHVLFDFIHIKNDMDNWAAGAGDVFIEYTIHSGGNEIKGRWPSSGDIGIDSGEAREIGKLGGVLAFSASSGEVKVRVKIMDADSWFTGGDDLIGEDEFIFNNSSSFGITQTTHIFDKNNYRITLSVYQSGSTEES